MLKQVLVLVFAVVVIWFGVGGCPTEALPENIVPPDQRLPDDDLDPIDDGVTDDPDDPADPGDDPADDPNDDPNDTPDDPGDDPMDDPRDDPGDDPGVDPGDDPGDDPNTDPGDGPGDAPGDDPGDDPPADDPGGPAAYIGNDYSGDIAVAFEGSVEEIPNSTTTRDYNETLAFAFSNAGRLETIPVAGYLSPYNDWYVFDVPVAANVGDTETLDETYLLVNGTRQYTVEMDITVVSASYTANAVTIELELEYTGTEGARTDVGTGTHLLEITFAGDTLSVTSTTDWSVEASGAFTFVETSEVSGDLDLQ